VVAQIDHLRNPRAEDIGQRARRGVQLHSLLAYFKREGEVLLHRHMRKKRVVLEHHADVALLRGMLSIERPSRRILPRVGASKPASIMRIVLPEPDGPSIVKNSPRAISKVRFLTTTVSPS